MGRAQSTPKTVVAVSGDGIHRILQKNGLDPKKYYREFIRLNKKKLGPKNGLYIGSTYILPKKDGAKDSSPADDKPSTPKSLTEPLFGKKHAEVKLEDESLKGAVYYLISGHGGPDPGAVVKKEGKLVSEDEYAYDVNLRLAR